MSEPRVPDIADVGGVLLTRILTSEPRGEDGEPRRIYAMKCDLCGEITPFGYGAAMVLAWIDHAATHSDDE